jgi:hypothetical protein
MENLIEIIKKKNIRLHVATPCYDCKMTARYATSIIHLQAQCMQNGIGISMEFLGNESLITRARNVLLGRFLLGEATHLLFIDADIGFDPVSVFRLLAFDRQNVITTGIYPKKNLDWKRVAESSRNGNTNEPLMSRGLDYNINYTGDKTVPEIVLNGFVPVLDAATGFFLISRGLLEKMVDFYRPTLECVNDIQNSMSTLPKYVALFDCLIDEDTRRYLSEDYAFVRRAQKAFGTEIWADTLLPLSHTGSLLFHGDISQRFVARLRDAM